jgi:hypothetical protein
MKFKHSHQFNLKLFTETAPISIKQTREPRSRFDADKEEELCCNGCNNGAVLLLEGALGECEAGCGDVGKGGDGALFAMTVITTFSPSSHRVWFPLMKKNSPGRPRS